MIRFQAAKTTGVFCWAIGPKCMISRETGHVVFSVLFLRLVRFMRLRHVPSSL
jgi:hypothetical protein